MCVCVCVWVCVCVCSSRPHLQLLDAELLALLLGCAQHVVEGVLLLLLVLLLHLLLDDLLHAGVEDLSGFDALRDASVSQTLQHRGLLPCCWDHPGCAAAGVSHLA